MDICLFFRKEEWRFGFAFIPKILSGIGSIYQLMSKRIQDVVVLAANKNYRYKFWYKI